MKISKIFAALTIVAVVGSSAFANVSATVTTASGKRKAYSVIASADGKLIVQYEKGGPKLTLKPKQYKISDVQFPKDEFKKMDKSFASKNYPNAIVEAKTLYDKYKWLGEGVKPAQVWGNSLFAQKKYNDALAVFVNAKRHLSGDDLLTVTLGEARCLGALGKNKELAALFPRLVKRGGSAAAFVFNTQGGMAKAQKNNEEALLAYMKTFTLFSAEDDSVKSYRAEAKKEIIAIFKAMGDNRAKTFVNEK